MHLPVSVSQQSHIFYILILKRADWWWAVLAASTYIHIPDLQCSEEEGEVRAEVFVCVQGGCNWFIASWRQSAHKKVALE